MKSIRSLAKCCSVFALFSLAIGAYSTQAAEVLSNIGLEESAGPASWTVTQSVTGEPDLFANVFEHLGGAANYPEAIVGELGIRVRPFAGNVGAFAGQNKAVNYSMSQTFTFGSQAATRTYTMTGHAYFQAAASNILENLIGSPVEGDFNNNSAVDAADYTAWRDNLGSETALPNSADTTGMVDQEEYDLWKTNFGQMGQTGAPSPTETYFELAFLNASDVVLATHTYDLRDDPTTEAWREHMVSGVAPAGTTKIRVSAVATDMVASCTSNCPAGQDVRFDAFSLVDNSVAIERLVNGNLNTLGAPDGWQIEKTSEDNLSFAGSPSFAANSGNVGMWLRSFAGGDAKLIQTVPAVAGAEYDLSAFSKWETGYNGADPFSSTQTFMTLEYLDVAEAVLDSHTLDLRTVQINDGTWRQLMLDGGTAPTGTVNVRVSVGATGMASSGINPQSAFFDDFSLFETLPGLGAIAAVPEPGAAALFGIGLVLMGIGRRRG